MRPAWQRKLGRVGGGVQARQPAHRAQLTATMLYPPPRVRSAILQATVMANAGLVQRVGRQIFAYRRKHLSRALRDSSGCDSQTAGALWRASRTRPTTRVEKLAVADLLRLGRVVQTAGGSFMCWCVYWVSR